MSVDRLFSVFRTASTGMAAQRRQLMVSSENIANAHTTKVEDGEGPYKPKQLVSSAEDQDEKFRQYFNKSRLNLRMTRNEHLENIAQKARGEGSQDMGPNQEITEVEKYRYEYDPSHPDADENGMVKYPDLDLVQEMTKMVSANRLYEANMSVVEAEKSVIKQALRI